MAKQLETILEDLDSKIASIIDDLEWLQGDTDDETYEEAQDYIDNLEHIRGQINIDDNDDGLSQEVFEAEQLNKDKDI